MEGAGRTRRKNERSEVKEREGGCQLDIFLYVQFI